MWGVQEPRRNKRGRVTLHSLACLPHRLSPANPPFLCTAIAHTGSLSLPPSLPTTMLLLQRKFKKVRWCSPASRPEPPSSLLSSLTSSLLPTACDICHQQRNRFWPLGWGQSEDPGLGRAGVSGVQVSLGLAGREH